MYLIKQKGKEINAQNLKINDVISINKKWYIIREELKLEDILKLTGLRDKELYTFDVSVGFSKVCDLRKIGIVLEDRWVEKLRYRKLKDKDIDIDKKDTNKDNTNTTKTETHNE